MSEAQSASTEQPEIVGVVPMAGHATRLKGLGGGSKELLAAAHPQAPQDRAPVCEHLLRALRLAGVREAYLVIRDGKWDIPAHLGDGSRLDLHLAYLMMAHPWGTPYSIDQAYAFLRGRHVALGFPDMCFADSDIFPPLLRHQQHSGADLVLGLFPADRPAKVDMVRTDENGRLREILIKPARTDLRQTWGVALWTPRFSDFMHAFLATQQPHASARELHVGDVISAGITAGLDLQAVTVSQHPFVDIGTLDDLARAGDLDRGR